MTITTLILALLLAVASLSLAEDHYVSAHNDKDCPADSDCHSLSYYLSDPELYFTSNTRITFLEGTHLLDREEPVKISQVTDLTLFGSGQWVRGPEETIMESTTKQHRLTSSFNLSAQREVEDINLHLGVWYFVLYSSGSER